MLEIIRFDPTPCGYPKPQIPVLPKRLQLTLFNQGVPKSPSSRRRPGSSSSSCHDSDLPRNNEFRKSNFRCFARGRYALCAAYELAGLTSGTTLLAPSYHCLTMLDPAIHLGADVQLYPLNPDLSPNLARLDTLFGECTSPVKALVATHFFGIRQDFSTLKQWCDQRHITLIEDCSHTLFTEDCQAPGIGLFGSFIAASPYKFFPCEDGGLLYVRDESVLRNHSETLKHLSFRRRPESRKFNKLDSGLRRNDESSIKQRSRNTVALSLAEELRTAKRTLEHHAAARDKVPDNLDRQLSALLQTPNTPAATTQRGYNKPSASFAQNLIDQPASRISRWIVRNSSPEAIARQRRTNFSRWLDATHDLPNCRPLYQQLPEDCVPYMFPLYIKHPEPHFDLLKRLGFPVWRWDEMAVSACRMATDCRRHLLHLPCHQSLTETQMNWLVSALQKVMQTPANGES